MHRLSKKDPAKAQKLLNNFTTAIVGAVFAVTDEFTNELITMQSAEINSMYKFPGA
ncbi:hypothetical protein [Candidatus Francisella endociliophora]|uniref:hypothetical protein n=1 Tax=Candidatus Francisella endociliophora TaxID=653937 RepID=UPI000AFEB241|nr:hypothetical protein [Francisella sp. FSC1006]